LSLKKGKLYDIFSCITSYFFKSITDGSQAAKEMRAMWSYAGDGWRTNLSYEKREIAERFQQLNT
jgi:hypothetical protein